MSDEAIERIFAFWKTTYNHPRAALDKKRTKVIREALKLYTERDLTESIAGYKNSTHHMGQNDRHTVYDDIELFLRDAKHIDAGLRFFAEPKAKALVAPELRNAH